MRLARTLVAAGTGGLLVTLIELITGGFVLSVGPFSLSAHDWRTPLALGGGAWVLLLWRARSRAVEALGEVAGTLERHATALALVAAAAAAGLGVGYGTFAASGSDASGYVSYGELLAGGRLAFAEPLSLQVPWPHATATFSPLGYRAGVPAGEIVPTYPSGLPLAIAAASLVAGQAGAFLVVPLLGALAVFCTYRLGAALYSRTAGALGAMVLTTSPIFLFQIVQPMSDVPATAWWTLAFTIALSHIARAPQLAGLVSGAAVLTRPNLVPLVVPVALALAGWPSHTDGWRPRVTRLIGYGAWLSVGLAALVLLQWRQFGHPLATGYVGTDEFFSLAHIWPNVGAYTSRLVRSDIAVLWAAAIAAGVLAFTRARRRPDQAHALKPPRRVAALFAAVVVASYLPYLELPEWFSLRLLLPAFPVLLVLAGALLARAASGLPAQLRGVLLLAVGTAVCSVNVLHAGREQAFNLRRYEARYRTAGRYLEAALPAGSVVFAVQQSGSVRHYARVPVVRWDLLDVELDAAVADLETLGRHPVFLVEDGETLDLSLRFPRSEIAKLDWRPRAEFGDETRVRLFDPADRASPGAPAFTDRVH